MYELALFAGAGGGLLATKWLLGWCTVCYVELDAYCVTALKARIRDGLLDDAPIWGDVRTFDGTPWRGCVDVVTAGFPCQPFSQAGKGLGEADDRNLWPDTIRAIREVRPRFVLLENVPRLLSHSYFGTILGDLATCGYDTRWDCVPASAIGANHERDRLWIVAHARGGRCRADEPRLPAWQPDFAGGSAKMADANRGGFAQHGECDSREEPRQQTPQRCDIGGCSEDVADALRSHGGEKRQRRRITQPGSSQEEGHTRWWLVEPPLGRVAHGVADRVGQLRAIGQGQVPAVVAIVWRLLSEF